jgi:hypothetical protein
LEFEQSWPVELADPVKLYSDFLDEISSATDLGVYACCGCIEQHRRCFQLLSLYSHFLSSLSVDPDHGLFPFACGIPHLDGQHIMVKPNGILLFDNGQLSLAICQSCHNGLKSSQNYIPPSRSRSGFAMEESDTPYHQGDLPFDTSAILDVNNVSLSDTAVTLHALRKFALEVTAEPDREVDPERSQSVDPSARVTVNVVNGSTIHNDWDDPTYFTSSYPVCFLGGPAGI